MSFAKALDVVLAYEGGFVNDPRDRGGATNLGISLRFALELQPWEKLELDADADGDIDAVDIKAITREKAETLYLRHFWRPVRGDDLPGPLAVHAFDCAVNQGPRVAKLLLQKSVGAKVDGVLGPVTMRLASEAYERSWLKVLDEFAARRMAHYAALPQSQTFILGWARRLFGVHGVCTRGI